jgi:DNA gyrase subunit A
LRHNCQYEEQSGQTQRLQLTIGRNTQGVRIMKLDEGDSLASCAVIASEDIEAEAVRVAGQEAAAAAQAAAEDAVAKARKPQDAAPEEADMLDQPEALGDSEDDADIDVQTDDDAEE